MDLQELLDEEGHFYRDLHLDLKIITIIIIITICPGYKISEKSLHMWVSLQEIKENYMFFLCLLLLCIFRVLVQKRIVLVVFKILPDHCN